MKSFKKSFAYGSMEYAVIAGLVIIVAIIGIKAVKGKGIESASLIDRANLEVGSIIGDEGLIAPNPEVPMKQISVIFPDPVPIIEILPEFISKEQIKNFLIKNLFIIKDSNENVIIDYEIENILKVDSFIQMDIIYLEKKENVKIPCLAVSTPLPKGFYNPQYPYKAIFIATNHPGGHYYAISKGPFILRSSGGGFAAYANSSTKSGNMEADFDEASANSGYSIADINNLYFSNHEILH